MCSPEMASPEHQRWHGRGSLAACSGELKSTREIEMRLTIQLYTKAEE